jgi:hypothetical protein
MGRRLPKTKLTESLAGQESLATRGHAFVSRHLDPAQNEARRDRDRPARASASTDNRVSPLTALVRNGTSTAEKENATLGAKPCVGHPAAPAVSRPGGLFQKHIESMIKVHFDRAISVE